MKCCLVFATAYSYWLLIVVLCSSTCCCSRNGGSDACSWLRPSWQYEKFSVSMHVAAIVWCICEPYKQCEVVMSMIGRLLKTSKSSFKRDHSVGRKSRRSVVSTSSQTLAFRTLTHSFVNLQWFLVSSLLISSLLHICYLCASCTGEAVIVFSHVCWSVSVSTVCMQKLKKNYLSESDAT